MQRELKRELAEAFVTARAAYRVFDNQYVAAIGTEEQAAAFERAIAEAEAQNAAAARKQLIAAGEALRNSDWSGSIRESIHAVEAMAVHLAPGTEGRPQGDRASGHLHGGSRRVRLALWLLKRRGGRPPCARCRDESQVDEADALFMLGACASHSCQIRWTPTQPLLPHECETVIS